MKRIRLMLGISLGLLAGSSQMSFAQVKIGTSPTTISPNNNLEVEASTTGRKTFINKTDGKVTIADGSQGNGYILTSDANGMATWQPPAIIKVPTTVFFGELTTIPTTIPAYATNPGAAENRIPLTPTFPASGWYAPERRYTIPVGQDGTYSVQGGLSCLGPNTAGITLNTRIFIDFINPTPTGDTGPLVTGTRTISGVSGDWLTVVYTGKLKAGDAISLEGYTTMGNTLAAPSDKGSCGTAYLTITRLD